MKKAINFTIFLPIFTTKRPFIIILSDVHSIKMRNDRKTLVRSLTLP